MRAAVKFHRALRRARANLGDDIDRDARFSGNRVDFGQKFRREAKQNLVLLAALQRSLARAGDPARTHTASLKQSGQILREPVANVHRRADELRRLVKKLIAQDGPDEARIF